MKTDSKKRFTSRASFYSQARPDYPDQAVDYICSLAALTPASRLADIGAGTGISSRAFARRGFHVTAVEPNEKMLKEAESNPEQKHMISYIRASAEETGLQSDYFDAVISAQAFHWFNPELALVEFKRILKEGAWLALIWNERDENQAFTKDYGDLLRSLPETFKVEMQRGEAGKPLMASKLFRNQEKKLFANQQTLDLEGLVKRALSASYAPEPGTDEALNFVRKLEDLFAKYEKDGFVTIEYESSVYAGQK